MENEMIRFIFAVWLAASPSAATQFGGGLAQLAENAPMEEYQKFYESWLTVMDRSVKQYASHISEFEAHRPTIEEKVTINRTGESFEVRPSGSAVARWKDGWDGDYYNRYQRYLNEAQKRLGEWTTRMNQWRAICEGSFPKLTLECRLNFRRHRAFGPRFRSCQEHPRWSARRSGSGSSHRRFLPQKVGQASA
jgi:hypothetical protein